MNPRPKRDRTNDNFLRATKNIIHRGDEMSRRYGADIYIVLRRKGRYYDSLAAVNVGSKPSSSSLIQRNPRTVNTNRGPSSLMLNRLDARPPS